MIKERELRIGNILSLKQHWGSEIVVIEAIYKKGFDVKSLTDNKEYTKLDRLSADAIPLSEGWLLKFGFVFNTAKRQYEINVDGFASEFPVWEFRDEMFIAPMGNDTGHIHINYVHQLQNIYFALTGEELTIKDLA